LKNSPYLCDMKTMREKLINAIFDMVSDEIENVSEAKKYAAMSDEQLVDEVINIAEYYRRQANEN
jgi:glycyl-tRNA synthetase beta subunit